MIKQWLDLLWKVLHVILTLLNLVHITSVWAFIWVFSGPIWPWVKLWLRLFGLTHSPEVVLSITFITFFAICWAISFPFTLVLSTVVTFFLTLKVSMIIFEASFDCFNWQSCGCYNPKQFSLGQLRLYLSGLIQTFHRVVCLIYFTKEMVLYLLVVGIKDELVFEELISIIPVFAFR